MVETTRAGRKRAAGIYGAVVTAAIIAAVGEQVPTRGLAVAVVVTLLVYWDVPAIPHRLRRVACFARFRQQQNSNGIEMTFRI